MPDRIMPALAVVLKPSIVGPALDEPMACSIRLLSGLYRRDAPIEGVYRQESAVQSGRRQIDIERRVSHYFLVLKFPLRKHMVIKEAS